MKTKIFTILFVLALLISAVGIRPAYADEGNSTPEPATSENAETPMPEAVESPAPLQPVDPEIASLSDEEQNGKFCKPPKPDCEYGEDKHGNCKPKPTETATATKTDHPTRTPRPTSTSTPTNEPTPTATQPSVTPTITSTGTGTSTITATSTITPTITQTPGPTLTNTSTATSTNTATGTPSLTPTATGTPTASATDDPTPTDENTGTPTATLTPTATITPTGTFVPTETATIVPTETIIVPTTPAPTLTPTQTPVITPSPEKDDEKGEKDNDEKPAAKGFIPVTGSCKGHDKVVFSINNTDTSNIWIYNPELTDGFMATNGVNGWNDAPSFDPNNPCIRFVYNHFGTIDGTGEIWINDGGNHPIEKDGAIVEGLSPDWGSNNKIAYVSIGQIWITNPNGTGQFNTGLYGSQPEWSWDAKALSFINDKGELTLVRTDDWTHIGGLDQSPYSAAIWSPDQTMVCDYDWRNQCLLFGQLTSTTAPYLGFSYEPRGNKMLIVVDDQHLEIRDDGPGFALSENQAFGTVTDWFTLDKASRIAIPGTE